MLNGLSLFTGIGVGNAVVPQQATKAFKCLVGL
jgi:hypothetical protein